MNYTSTVEDGVHDGVVLLSGGPDSAVLLHHMMRGYWRQPIALHFTGLSDRLETSAARMTAANAGVRLYEINLGSFLDACRTSRIDVAGEGQRAIFGAATTYAAALAFAIAHRIPTVAIGLHRHDAEAHVEQAPQFLEFIAEGVALVGNQCRLVAPFHGWTKAEVLRRGAELGVDIAPTWSCLMPIGTLQDGTCSACRARRAALDEAGMTDHTTYH